MFINEETFDALTVLKNLCSSQRLCSDCPLSVALNKNGDLRCIFQAARPCHFALEERREYLVKPIKASESEKE